MTTLAEVVGVAHELWPLAGAEEWDAPGLIVGDSAAEVKRVLLVVDAVAVTIAEALERDVDLVIAHHPLLLRGITTVAEDRYKGSIIAQLIRGNCALLAAHTNADVVQNGVSDVIAQALTLKKVSPIRAGSDESVGIGRVGELPKPTTLGALARTLADLLPPTATGIRVAGEYDQEVRSVALCGGAGDSLLAEPAVRASDVYITSDLRHHPASESREQALLGSGPALIDVSHWASEWLWLESAATQLRIALPEVEFIVSDLRTDPWDFVVVQ